MEKKAIESGYQGGVNEILQKVCSNIFFQMKAMVQIDSKIHPEFRDIFMEQGDYWLLEKALDFFSCT